jgi:hypothetical protein
MCTLTSIYIPPVRQNFKRVGRRTRPTASSPSQRTHSLSFVRSTFRFLSHLLTAHVDPHVYPHFNLYPARAAEPASREEDMTNGKFSVPAYPFLVVCAFYVPFS